METKYLHRWILLLCKPTECGIFPTDAEIGIRVKKQYKELERRCFAFEDEMEEILKENKNGS